MNNERMLATADVIEQTGRFHIATYMTWTHDERTPHRDAPSLYEVEHNCNTTACVAGWAAVLFRDPDEAAELGYDRQVADKAQAALDLTSEEAERLFYADDHESVWAQVADQYGWQTRPYRNIDGPIDDRKMLVDQGQISAPQAAQVIRDIVAGKVTL